MLKNVLFFCVVIGISSPFASAQDSTKSQVKLLNRADSLEHGWWTRKTQLAFNFSQASFNDSWQGGGISNIALGGIFNNRSVYCEGIQQILYAAEARVKEFMGGGGYGK